MFIRHRADSIDRLFEYSDGKFASEKGVTAKEQSPTRTYLKRSFSKFYDEDYCNQSRHLFKPESDGMVHTEFPDGLTDHF